MAVSAFTLFIAKRLDRDLRYAIAARGWQIAAGPVSLLFVYRFLGPEQQGFYYTFASLVALQIVFELGLSFVLQQFTAHEFVTLQWRNGTIIGNAAALDRLFAALRVSIVWFCGAAILFIVILVPLGLHFLGQEVADFAWKVPWTLLVIGTAANLVLVPFIAVIEGGGRVADVYYLRLLQAIGSSAVLWGSLAFSKSLYASSLASIASAVVGWLWLSRHAPALFSATRGIKSVPSFSWRTELLPMQWRMAISWVSGYFIWQLFTPITFHFRGATEAGRMGMTMVVVSALTQLGLTWIMVKVPSMANSAALRQWTLLDSIFGSTLRRSSVFIAAAAVAIMLLSSVSQNFAIGERFLSPFEVIVLLGWAVAGHFIGAMALYLRAHKREPFVWLSLVGAVLMALSMSYGASQWGTQGTVVAAFAVNVVYGLPSAFVLWRYSRASWHA